MTGMVVLNSEDSLLASDNNDHNSLISKCIFFYIFEDAAYSNVICYGEVRKFFSDIWDTSNRNKFVLKKKKDAV